jgi:hypothetical protein
MTSKSRMVLHRVYFLGSEGEMDIHLQAEEIRLQEVYGQALHKAMLALPSAATMSLRPWSLLSLAAVHLRGGDRRCPQPIPNSHN